MAHHFEFSPDDVWQLLGHVWSYLQHIDYYTVTCRVPCDNTRTCKHTRVHATTVYTQQHRGRCLHTPAHWMKYVENKSIHGQNAAHSSTQCLLCSVVRTGSTADVLRNRVFACRNVGLGLFYSVQFAYRCILKNK